MLVVVKEGRRRGRVGRSSWLSPGFVELFPMAWSTRGGHPCWERY